MSVVSSVVRSGVRRAMLVLAAAAVTVAGAVGAEAQVASGLYGNLTLGVDGTTVTGVFANALPGNGTEEEPQFTCSFLLRGTAGAGGTGAIPVTVWSPMGGSISGQLGGPQAENVTTRYVQTNGTLTVAQATAKLQLEGEPPGCAGTGDQFVARAYQEPAVKTGAWMAARMVSTAAVRLQEAPVSGGGGRGRVSRGDVVVVERRIGPWLQVETVFTAKPVRGWLREGDLYSSEP